jgi:hypothetical protein
VGRGQSVGLRPLLGLGRSHGGGHAPGDRGGRTLSDIDGRFWTVDSDSVIVNATADLQEELLDLARSASKLPR